MTGLEKFTINLLKPLSFFIHRGAAVELPACCTRALQQLGLWCRGWACQAVVVPWDLLFSKAMSMGAFTAQCSSYHLGKPLFWKSNSQPLHSVRTSFAAVESFFFLCRTDLLLHNSVCLEFMTVQLGYDSLLPSRVKHLGLYNFKSLREWITCEACVWLNPKLD